MTPPENAEYARAETGTPPADGSSLPEAAELRRNLEEALARIGAKLQ